MGLVYAMECVRLKLPVALQTRFFFGMENLPKLSAPPRIVIEPWQDDYTAALGPARVAQKNPQALRTRQAGARAHLWATTYEQMEGPEGLINAFMSALHSETRGSMTRDPQGLWVEANNDQALKRGVAYLLTFYVDVPVVPVPPNVPGFATISEIDEDCEIVAP